MLNLSKQTGREEYAHSGDLSIRERIGSGPNLENQGSVHYWPKDAPKVSTTPTQSPLKTCHHCPCFILKEGKITSFFFKKHENVPPEAQIKNVFVSLKSCLSFPRY